jgi:aminoglycoside 2''-phosphotransferase
MEDAESARASIQNNFPMLTVKKISLAGEGMDSRSFFVNDTHVFRFPKFPSVAEDVKVEIALLPKLQTRVMLPIPQFEFVGTGSNGMLFVGYKKIVGTTLHALWHTVGVDVQERILHTLGSFLTDVHAFPLQEAEQCGVPKHTSRRIYKGEFTRVAGDIYPLVSAEVKKYLEELYNRFLADERNFAYTPSFLHADFGGGHIFCDEKSGDVNGIIDFGDIGIGDPDYDLMYLYGEFGWEFIVRFLGYYHREDSDLDVLHHKLRFLLIFNTIDDIWMGRDRGDKKLETWALKRLSDQTKAMRELY